MNKSSSPHRQACLQGGPGDDDDDDDDDDETTTTRTGRQGGGARRGTKILVSRGRVSYPCPHSGPSWSSGASRGVDKTSIACFSVCLSPNRRAHCLRLINLCTDGGDVVLKVWFLLQRPARPPQRFPAGARTTEGGSFLKAGLTFEIFSRFAPMQFQHAQQSQGWKACFFPFVSKGGYRLRMSVLTRKYFKLGGSYTGWRAACVFKTGHPLAVFHSL